MQMFGNNSSKDIDIQDENNQYMILILSSSLIDD